MEIKACRHAGSWDQEAFHLSHPRGQILQYFLLVVIWLVLVCILLVAFPWALVPISHPDP